MAFILKDRVKESTVTTGTGNLSLAGAAATFDTFQSFLSNGDTTFYAVVHTSSGVDEWEVGLATWNTGNTLSRTTVLSGSNGTSAVNFSAGSKDIFMTLPADKLLHLDANGDVDINGGTIDGTVIGAAQAAASNFTTVDTTGNVSVGGQLDISDWIDLSAQASHPAHGEGRLWYDTIHKTLNYYSDDAGVVHELGIEEHARVYNETGSTLSKGTPVHFAGTKSSNGTHVPTVAAANATSSTKYKSEGMIAADIANNSYGYIITAGRLEGIDTSHLSIGQFFTGITDGSTQTAAPVYPNFPMCLGFVVRSDATNGVVFLAQQNHSIKSFRVQMDQHIGGSLTIDGDLNVTGSTNTTSTSDVTAGAPFYRANEGDAIGDANTTFTGSGLDDAFFAGHFTGTTSTTYYVKIDSVGTPDTFAVSTDNFSTTISTGNAITGSEQMIHSADNISVKFGATTGHTLNDVWTGTALPVNVDTGFFSNRNTGTSGVGYTHMGLFYDASDSKWRLVDEYDPTPAGTIDTSHSSYVAGTIAANLEGNVTGNITGNVSGNAATASALESARTIGGVSFDGTANIDLAGVNTSGNQDTTGNAATATALENARTIQVSGDVTGSASFDGTSDITITTTVQDDSHAHVISNVDGLQSALDAKVPTSRTITAGNGLTGGGDLTANRTLTVGGGTGITVNANDIAIDSSYTGFDGRYYTETEADSRFVNVTGGTMTGTLTLTGSSSTSRLRLEGTAPTMDFDDSDGDSFFIHVNSNNFYVLADRNGGGNYNDWETPHPLMLEADNNIGYVFGSRMFHETYHPNADKWTTSRTLSLTGDVTGSVSWDGSGNASLSTTVANDSHTHDGRYYTETEADGRFARGQVSIGSTNADSLTIQGFYGNSNASTNQPIDNNAGTIIHMRGSDGGYKTQLFSYSDNRLWQRGKHGNNQSWGSWQRVFMDNYHPNADKWTTARTLTLAGDVTGSVSWDGSANVTLTATVADDSHDLTWANIDGETANSVNSWGGLRHQTNDGYIDFGPANTGHAHIYTDRPNFYFNKELLVNNQQVFHSGYHPNADTLTTARTINGVSFNGSANITVADSTKLPLSGGTMTGELQLNARLDVGNGTNSNHEIRIYKADNNVSDHIQFYNGTTRMGEIGCEDTTWLRINQETAKNIYTPRIIRADGGFQAASTICAHVSDTNTYIQFHANDQWRVVTGGAERLEVNNTNTTVTNDLRNNDFRNQSSIRRNTLNAWLTFNGTGTPSIRDDEGVTSVSDLGTGRYRANFSMTMPAGNYSFTGAAAGGDESVVYWSNATIPSPYSTTQFNVEVQDSNSGGVRDSSYVWCQWASDAS